jgi:ABC-type iron transport system FetAB ATPase subunit
VLVVEKLRRPGFGPFDLALGDGACCVVTGPSGAGKSVLLRMIADLDPNEGSVALDGTRRETIPAPAWRRRVTYVPAESGWWAETVDEHFATTEGVEAGLAALRLPPEALAWPVARLSTGERQRLALLRALVQDPRVLLLDEPTSALDEETTRAVEAVLTQRLDRGAIILLVSHAGAQADRMATTRLAIEHGRPVGGGAH